MLIAARRFPGFFSAALLLVTYGGVRAQTAPVPPTTPFTSQALADFDQWDINRNGILSRAEVDSWVADPSVTGSHAAALGAMKLALRSGKVKMPPITRDYLRAYARDAQQATAPKPASTEEFDTDDDTLANPALEVKKFPRFDFNYTSCLDRLQRATSFVFANQGLPHCSDLRQGQIGDCYFVSVIGALVNRDPRAVREMIAVQPNGSYKVTFPSGRVVPVARLSETEIAVGSSTRSTGHWLAVLEKAFGEIQNDLRDEDDQKEIVTDVIAKGGSAGRVIRQLTRHDTNQFSLRGTRKSIPLASKIASKLPRVRTLLATSFKARRLCTAHITKDKVRPPAVNGNHVYTVIAYDADRDTIRLWNPHGNTFTPLGVPGLLNGYPTVDGEFEMPLIEFAQTFSVLTCETSKPYKPSTKSSSKTTKSRS